jgi:aspartate aminotransferase-like enzyme
MGEVNLLIPGPTPLPPEVRAAMSRPMVSHRGEEFGQMLAGLLASLQQIFQTAAPILPFAASGTGGMEAAIVNVCSPGDRVLALSCGVFGDRFAAIARAFGAEVIVESVEWGRGLDPAAVEEALRRHRGIKAVLVTHNETSTGVANHLQEVAEAVRPSGALLLVDAVSSLGALDLRMDAWGIDVVITASQKALMGPPGAVFIAAGPRAWEAVESSTMPKTYFSFARAKEELTSGTKEDLSPGLAYTPFTPAIPVLYALHVAVGMILREGLPARFAHHARLGRATRAGITALGLDLFPHPAWASDTLTTVRVPQGIDAALLLRRLRTEHDVVIAGGPGRLEGKIFRIAHMGYVQEEQILAALDALEHVLSRLGHRVAHGAAVDGAAEVLQGEGSGRGGRAV